MSNPYKVGDRIRFIDGHTDELQGKVATVLALGTTVGDLLNEAFTFDPKECGLDPRGLDRMWGYVEGTELVERGRPGLADRKQKRRLLV